jgi:L-threonylcarbamoyladenylate synthase
MDELQAIAIDDQRAPDLAVRAIASGSVIAFPTDTVYGLGAGLWRPDAITKLYTLKGRPDEKALPVLLAAEEQWTEAATEASEAALRLMRRFWPGALTIVLPRRLDVPDAVGPLTRTIALRVPGHEGLRRILARTGPLASSSANRSGQPPTTSATQTLDELGHGLALTLDGGALPPRPPSTVVDVTGPEPIIVRQGAITADAIARALAARDEYNKP